MTRKDFEALAGIIKQVSDSKITVREYDGVVILAESIADYCEQDNNMFDREIFLAACGLSDVTPKDVRKARKVAREITK